MTVQFITSTDKNGDRHQWRYTPDTTTLDHSRYYDPEMPTWDTIDTNVTEPHLHIRLVGHTIKDMP